ncbi:hypothetical protein OJF2_03400 [Aquisphaera giovannonii]|uniref:Uncharacterized protein n=1 Tax=Aquisphaera giovannonii TaxID=406548 RepID=A0A5B9VU27_9BACT|nr:hypothetical protein [Aquisphaera giovannonii]QEH31873.1 hypothetical protein OJF2_03400 [Aquisphaera giovannonii]
MPNPPLRRVNYFTGRVLTANDLKAEQDYFRERLRRHNLLFHGPGVVSGLEVEVEGDSARVGPGVAVDANGEELVVPSLEIVPIPHLAEAMFVTLRFVEKPAEPMPGAGGDGGPAEFAFTEESAVVGVVAEGGDGVVLARLVREGDGWAVDPGHAPEVSGTFIG